MCLVSFFASSFFWVKEASKLASALYLYGIVWSVFTRAERGVMIRSVIVRFCFGFDCWVGSYQDKWWHLCADWLMPQTKDIWIVSKYRCNLRLLKKAKILDSWHQNMSKKIGHWIRLEWKKCPVFTTYKGCINPVCHSNSVFNCKMCFYEQKYWMEIAHCEQQQVFPFYFVEEIANSVQMLNGPQNGTKNGCNFPA